MFVLTLLVTVGVLFRPCLGKTFYCPDINSNYGMIDLHAEGVRVDSMSFIAFQTKGNNDAHILLQQHRYSLNYLIVEIVLGGWANTRSVIRNKQQGRPLATYKGAVLDPGSYKWFWISWNGGCVHVGTGRYVGSNSIMNACGLISSVAGLRISYGWGSDGHFIFDMYTFSLGILPNYSCDNLTLDIASENGGTAQLTVPFLNIDRMETLNAGLTTIDLSCDLVKKGTFVEMRGIHLFAASTISLYATHYDGDSADTFHVSPLSQTSNDFKIISHADCNYMVVGANDGTMVYIYRPISKSLLMTPLISANEIIQISSAADLTLSKVQSTKPVTVISGCSYVSVPSGACCGDTLMSQMIPVYVWSTTYIIPPIPPMEGFLIKVIKADENNPFEFCAKDPDEDICETGESLTHMFGTEPVIVTADYPISVAQIGTSRGYSSLSIGDPFMSVIQGIDNYLSKYVFAVPLVYRSFTNYIAATIPTVHRDGLRLDGSPFTSNYTFNVPAPLDHYTVVIVEVSQGYHVMEHIDPAVLFGLQVYGLGTYPGYGYPADFKTYINECDSNPCQNEATCINNQNNYTCTCTDGWMGHSCDQDMRNDIYECDSNPCQNGATCNNNQNQYTCTCADGWQGYNCDQDINGCDSNPCQNGATCNNNQNHYTCTCADGWQGDNCDQDINECDSNPCKNGATCQNNQNHFTCTCADGWQGYNCDQDINECDSNPCQNGATCNNNQNHYTCTCTDGWQGYNCDQDIDECTSNPCLNEITCNNLENLYTCTCAEGWKGYNCHIPDVTFYCYPNNTIYVYYLPTGAYSYAMQNTTTTGTDVQCTIMTIDPRTVKMTGCSKDLPILFTFGTYTNMDTYQLHAGDSFTAITIKCNEIPDTGNIHGVNNILSASLQLDEEAVIDPSYDVTSSLNTTSTVIGSTVAWTISFPVEYILEVSSCKAYPGTDHFSPLHVTLISTGGCHEDRQLISDFVDNMDGSATAIIKAFKFYEEENVFLQCLVTICPDVAGQSCDTSCSRTKRAIRPTASENPVSRYQRSIQNILRVVEPSFSGTVVHVPVFTAGVTFTLTLLSVVSLL